MQKTDGQTIVHLSAGLPLVAGTGTGSDAVYFALYIY